MQIKLIPVTQLMSDPDVQFEWAFDQRIARKIGLAYDPMLAGVIDVVPLNGPNTGMYGVFVGRHRLHGAKAAGEKVMRCAIWSDKMSISEKHRIKLGKDRDRRRVRAVEMFLSEVGAEELVACDIMSICEEHGYTIGKLSGGKPYEQFECTQTLRMIHARGRDHLRKVLTLNTLWKGELKTNTTNWLGGLDRAASEDWVDRIPPSGYSRMKELIPAKIIREAQALSTVRGSGLGNTAGTAPHIADRLRKASGARRRPQQPE